MLRICTSRSALLDSTVDGMLTGILEYVFIVNDSVDEIVVNVCIDVLGHALEHRLFLLIFRRACRCAARSR